MEGFQLSDKGAVRAVNEDSCGEVYSKDGAIHFFIVADGMGGHLAGEIASRMATELFAGAASEYEHRDEFGLRRFLSIAMRSIDSEITARAGSDEECKDMGTTAVVYASSKDGYGLFCNIGDSRGYVMRSGDLIQVTKDHSLVQSMLDSGYVFSGEDEKQTYSHAITKALGFMKNVRSEVNCDIFKIRLKKGDTVLLCSDGLTSMLSDGEIAEILKQDLNLEIMGKMLVEAANKNGGHDNITVSLIRYSGEDFNE